MPREGLTIEEVRQAKADLEERGVTATYRRIRAELGRGSYATIQEHIRAIRASETTQDATVEPLPAAFRQRVDELGEAAWKEARSIATADLADIKSAYHARTEVVESELSEALKAIESLEEDLERRESELAEAEKQLVTLVDTVKRHEVLLAESARRESEATRRFEEYVSQLDRTIGTLSKAVNTGMRRSSAKPKAKTDQT